MTGLLDHFQEAVEKLAPEFPNSSDTLGLAVSGGPDSLALLLLAHHSYPGRVAAATVDHGLRPEAKSEAEYVAKICAQKNIPHQVLTPSIPIRGNIQSEARKVRYSLLNSWMKREGLALLATAHHADDQLETLVMRILRGSGIDGMSAIRARRGPIIRPLLRLPKDLLVEYTASHDIAAVDDPSNRDQGFDRIRVRNALSRLEGFDVGLASQSAAALNDAREAIGWIIDKLGAEHIRSTGNGCTLEIIDFPNEILRRLTLRCLHECEPALSPRGEQLDRAIEALKEGETITLGNTLCEGGENWTFGPAPARRS